MEVHLVARAIVAWLAVVVGLLAASLLTADGEAAFFRIGPHADLVLFGARVDTLRRYGVVVLYTLCSGAMRTLHHQLVTPWILQNVQHAGPKSAYARLHGHEVVTIDVAYQWLDWLAYTVILVTQVDLFAIEMTSDLCISYFLTTRYLAVAGD